MVIPVIVGVGRKTQKPQKNLECAMDPIQLAQVATEEALADAQVPPEAIDAVMFIDMLGEFRLPRKMYPAYENPAQSVARACGLEKATRLFKSQLGGNMPQYCINEACERIANGEFSACLITGAEAIDTLERAKKKKFQLDSKQKTSETAKTLHWGDKTGQAAESVGSKEQVTGIQDVLHDLHEMPAAYALIEQAVQRADRVSTTDRAHGNAKIFHGYSKVAAFNENREHSWFPAERSVEEIQVVSQANRMVASPHCKLNCAIMDVNQAASVIVMSDQRARQLGVPEEKWVYLHGGADCNDVGVNILQKPHLDRCPGMKIVAEETFRAANVKPQDISFYDVYSCFPIAVRLACREMNLPVDPEKDSERLTVTGGLPFHGGPGNNYVLHAIAAMVQKLRENRGKFGLVTANGGVLSKHAAGVYSTVSYAHTHPGKTKWDSRPDCSAILEHVSSQTPRRVVAKAPKDCVGSVSNFTIRYSGKGKPVSITAVGDVLSGPDTGKRFVAKSSDEDVMKTVLANEQAFFGARVLLDSSDMSGKGKVFMTQFEIETIKANSRL